jgi:prepilin-type N-terminal cleavage/methylation domain-containing protein
MNIKNKGFSLLEVILATSILGLLLTTVSTSIISGYRNSLLAGVSARAVFLAEEGIEGVKNIRDNKFFDLQDGVHDIISSVGAWALQAFIESPSEALQRKITITTIESTPNLERKEVKVEVLQWKNYQVGPATSTPLVILITRFANWSPTVVDWGSPKLGGSFDFNSQNSGSNSHDARAVLVDGNYLYVGNKSSAGKEFIILSIADTPNLSILGTLDLQGNPLKMVAEGNYVYIASGNNTEELQIIDVSNKSSPLPAAIYDLSGNSDPTSITMWGNYVFLGRDVAGQNEFFVFDIGVGLGCLPISPCLISQVILITGEQTSYEILDMMASSDGNYVYVIAEDGKFLRVNVTNKYSPVVDAAVVNTHGGSKFVLTITDTRAYVGTQGVTGSGIDKDEIYIIDVSNPATQNPYVMKSFNLGDNGVDVKSVSFAADVKHLITITGDTSKDLQIINVSNDLSPSLKGVLDLQDTVYAADWSPVYYTEYVVGQVPSAEIQMVNPNLIY